MTISDGSVITAADLSTIWSGGLQNLQDAGKRHVYTQEITWIFDGASAQTPTAYLETVYTPPTDICVRAIVFYIYDTQNGGVALYTCTITGNIIQNPITLGPVEPSGSGFTGIIFDLDNGDIDRLIMLAGDNIIFTITSTATAPISARTKVRVSMLYEQRLQVR